MIVSGYVIVTEGRNLFGVRHCKQWKFLLIAHIPFFIPDAYFFITFTVFDCPSFSMRKKYIPAGRCSKRRVSSGLVNIWVWTTTPAALMTCRDGARPVSTEISSFAGWNPNVLSNYDTWYPECRHLATKSRKYSHHLFLAMCAIISTEGRNLIFFNIWLLAATSL